MKRLSYLLVSLLFTGLLLAQDFSVTPEQKQVKDERQSPEALVEIHYDGDNFTAIGDGDLTFFGAAKFRSELFTGLVGGEMQFVEVYIWDMPTGLTLHVWDQGTSGSPGTELLSQSIDLGTITANSWNTIELSSYITITGNELWVGFEVEEAGGGIFPLGTDDGSAYDADGDWVLDPTMTVWGHLADFGLVYNWNIRALVEEPTGGGGGTLFFDDFEAYTAGQQLACQNPMDWSTWSDLPCDPTEDPLISTDQAYSGVNSVNIVLNNDCVKPLGDLTSGKYQINFYMYIPTGSDGYFNTLSIWDPAGLNYEWAMQAFFNAGGQGSLDAGGASAATFTFSYDTWFLVSVVVDLDNDMAEFWVDNSQIYTWQWTLGALGGGGSLQLAANDFFGFTNNNYYIDDYEFIDLLFVPVELTSFTADVNADGSVQLNWTTATELNNQMFEIQRSTENGQFVTIGYVDGHGTTTEQQQYSYVDRTVETGKYFYRLKQIDFLGSYEYSDVVEVDVKGPLTYNLEQNYPNPFNPSTNIKYSVATSGHIRLAVYNLIGEEVSVLVDGLVDAGFYEVTFNATNLPSGIYFYKLEAPGFVQVKKMMLMK